MNTWQDAQDFVSLCKGARASIILLFLFAEGRSLTKEAICKGVNYSDKPVKTALDWLEARAIVQYNGHSQGYSLSNGVKQLDFIRQLVGLSELPTPASELAISAHVGIGEPATTSHDGVVVPEFGTSSHDDGRQTAGSIADESGASDDRKVSDISESFRHSTHVCMFKHNTKTNNQKHTKHEHQQPRKNSEQLEISEETLRLNLRLKLVLQLVGVSGPNLDKLTSEDTPLSWPLAWWLDLQSQPWKPDNAGGWVFMRLKEGKVPKKKYLNESELHLSNWADGDDLELPVIDSKSESATDELIRQGVIHR